MMSLGQMTSLLASLGGTAVIAMLRSLLRNAICKDIISQLPDDLLISIISRMDTESAVRTSILSKRWCNLYKSVSDINLSCLNLLGDLDFSSAHDAKPAICLRLLERFLRHRSSSGSKIRSFNFECGFSKSDADLFKQCIQILGILEVEELVLSHCDYAWENGLEYLPFSCYLLSEMPSLKCFRLARWNLQPGLKTQCNSLQIISLKYVFIDPGALEVILSSCLNLHSLTIADCCSPSKLCFRGCNLQLKSLVIKHCIFTTEIEFYASNLIFLEIQRQQMLKLKFDHIPQLQCVKVPLANKYFVSYVFEDLANDLPHLKSLALTIEHDLSEVFSGLANKGIQTFGNIRRLEIWISCSSINMLALPPFLECCPRMQEFYMDIPDDLEYHRRAQFTKQPVLHSELRKVGISGFTANEHQMRFALYILESAISLEEMHIFWCLKDCSKMQGLTQRCLQERALSKIARVVVKSARALN